MTKPFCFCLVYIFGEIGAFFIFKMMNYFLENKLEFHVNISVVKGMVERLFMFLALVYNFPHAMIAFGAIKIGTRIKLDEKISNDYFFLGNMISLILTILVLELIRTSFQSSQPLLRIRNLRFSRISVFPEPKEFLVLLCGSALQAFFLV